MMSLYYPLMGLVTSKVTDGFLYKLRDVSFRNAGFLDLWTGEVIG